MQQVFADAARDATERPTIRAKKDRRVKIRSSPTQPILLTILGRPPAGPPTIIACLKKRSRSIYLGLLDLLDLLADLGYLALVADYGLPAQGRPQRKPLSKKHSHPVLTNTQRAENSVQAHPRVKVEHALSGAKRMGCVAQTCRNKSASFTAV